MKWCLLLSILVLCGVVSTSPGQIPAIDHYYAYTLTQPIPIVPPIPVTLNDQWGVGDVDVQALEKFANPVDKNGEGIIDFDLHYTWYRIDEPNIGRIVYVDNQFSQEGVTQTLFVTHAKFLLAPATKDSPDPPDPLGNNHYKCYEATGPPVNIDVLIADQWGNSGPTILEPVCFCNPAGKRHGPNFYDIVDPFAHLTCYKLINGHNGLPASIWDQFLQTSISNSTSCVLCVPTDKLATVPSKNSTWGNIKSLYK